MTSNVRCRSLTFGNVAASGLAVRIRATGSCIMASER
jgi:hypothetical protein